MKMRKVINVIKTAKALLSLCLYLTLSAAFGQKVTDHHSILNEIFESERKEKINLLLKVDLSTDWINDLEDSLFVNSTLRYSCNKESVVDLIEQIDLMKVRGLIQNKSEFNWQKKKLNSNFKLQKKMAPRGLTYQYSIPIKENDIVIVRIKSFDSYNNAIGNYIYFMRKDQNQVWITACILVIQEMFPDYN